MILVTGATGLVGSHLAMELVKRGYQVRGIFHNRHSIRKVEATARLYGKEYLGYYERIEWVEADVSDLHSIYEALEDVEEVYHCAGYISFHPGDNRQLMEINYRGTRNLVNACLEMGTGAFCMVSSVAALGSANDGEPLTEEAFWKNSKSKGGYGYSKYMGEMEVWRGVAEGLQAVIVNPSVILGPGHWESGSGKLFSRIRKGFRYYTEGITGYVDVYDVVHSMILLMEHKAYGQRYILNGENLSFKEVFEMIAASLHAKQPLKKAGYRLARLMCRFEWLKWKLTGLPPRITFQNLKSAYQEKYYTAEKIMQQMNFTFTPIKDSIRKTAGYYLKEEKEG